MVGLRHARPVEKRRLARVAGLCVDLHAWNYRCGCERLPCRHPPSGGAFEPKLLELVPAQRTGPAVAQHHRSVPRARVGSDAAADTGRPRAAQVSRVAGQVPVARGPGRRPTKPTSAPRGGRSATTSGRSACTRSRGSRWRRYGGQLPSDAETLLSFKGIGAYTAGAIRSFAFGQRAPILDTNVARVLFRVFIAKGDPKAHAMKRQLWQHSEAVLPFRHVYDFNQALMDLGRHGVRRAQPEVRRVPDAPVLPVVRHQASQAAEEDVTTVDVVAAVVDDGQTVPGDAASGRRPPGGAVGVSRRQGARRRIARAGASPRDARGAGSRRRGRRPGAVDVARAIPTAPCRCTSTGAGCSASPTPQLGQQMQWVTRAELGALEFPPADADLIALLSDS